MTFLLTTPVRFQLCREEDLRALEWMGLHTREREIIEGTFAAQQRGEALMLLAVANGFPIGQAWVDFAQRGTESCPRLWAVRVFPPLQSAGLGTRLMKQTELLVARRGARHAEIGVEWHNAGARRLYERLGYRPVGEEHEEVHYAFEGYPLAMTIDQQILRKQLSRSDPALERTARPSRSVKDQDAERPKSPRE